MAAPRPFLARALAIKPDAWDAALWDAGNLAIELVALGSRRSHGTGRAGGVGRRGPPGDKAEIADAVLSHRCDTTAPSALHLHIAPRRVLDQREHAFAGACSPRLFGFLRPDPGDIAGPPRPGTCAPPTPPSSRLSRKRFSGAPTSSVAFGGESFLLNLMEVKS